MEAISAMESSDSDCPSFVSTDTMVEWEATHVLRCSPYQSIRCLKCSFHEGVLTLRGRLPSYSLLQVTQTRVRRIAGVEAINNRIRVEWPTDS